MKSLILFVPLFAAMLTGCTLPSHHTTLAAGCKTGDNLTQTTLYFGLSRPTGPDISSEEWQSFVDTKVTPSFKEGLTVFDTQGQWLGKNGRVVQEKSKALLLIHSTEPRIDPAVEAIRTAYKQRFSQESVMRVDMPVCVSF